MTELWLIMLLHQSVFQGMFASKNILLHKKTGKQIRGNNIESNISIAFFALFIIVALSISFFKLPFAHFQLLGDHFSLFSGLLLMFINLVVSAAALINLKDSWRVGVLENQKTELIVTGIYRHTRNPYFVSYLLMFAAYTIILQNLILLGLSI